MWLKLTVFTSLLVLVYLCGQVKAQDQCDANGCRLGREASYFITSPKVIRPNQVVQMTVSILKLYYPQITVRCAIRRFDEDIATSMRKFTTEGHGIVQLKIPENAQPGNYTLRVEGTEQSGFGGSLFINETEIAYESKQVAVFIQPIKPFFHQGQTVHFRVMPVETNLMSRSGSMDVYITDATNTIVKRWLSMQTNAGGVLDLSYPISAQPKFGMWQIKVSAFGHDYTQDIEVIEFWGTYIDVNVSMPLYHIADDYAIAGSVMANMSVGQASRGNVTYTAEIRLPPGDRVPGKEYTWPTIKREVRYFPGTSDFMFTMEELAAANGGKIAGYEVYVEAYVFDWFIYTGASGSALTVIYPNDVELVILGDPARVFKPNQTMHVYFAVRHMDGTPLNRPRRQVKVTCVNAGGSLPQKTFVLADENGIVHWQYTPSYRDTRLTIQASYDNIDSRMVELHATRHYSISESYISITASTEKPEVDKYMVFTVTTNTFTEQVFYLITSSANIVTTGILEMTSTQKTFSLALSRDMIPECHIVVWHILKGEVIADSMNIFVNGTRINPVDINFNRGKDFTGNTVEVTGKTDPSSFIGALVMDYELWSRGWSSIITEADVIRELNTFEPHVNKSFSYTWKLPEEQEEMIHFPAPSYGIDANTTFDYAGLLVLTDANVTRIPNDCNETLGQLPCMDGNCYEKHQQCDGTRQCAEGADEMGCVYPVKEKYTPPKRRLSLLTRHYNSHTWVWGSHFVMPNGRLDAIVDVPDDVMTYVLGGFAISKDKGFGLIHNPPRHEGTRPFFVRSEAPGRIRKGEQVGIHIGLFNYWDQDVEALVMLHDSEDYRFIVVEEYGFVMSYDPRTIRGDIQTMVFVEKGRVRQIHFPVVPVKMGCITVTISVLTFIWTDKHELEMCSYYDGVTNHLHTPYFLDLVSVGFLQLHNLDIPVDEKFVNPQTRKHIYVPGSPEATVGIVGDVVGPGFFKDYPTAEDTLRKPWASAEQNMYNFAYTMLNLRYQRVSQQLSTARLRTSLTHLNTGLQRQLSYMNMDGSFQMFRDYPGYTPSTWVTAFTLRVLHEANLKEWEAEYFFIPNELLNKIALWLTKQQDSKGIFYERHAPNYDRKMESNMTVGDEHYPNVALTAYVLITLAEADGLTDAAEAAQAAVRKAMEYLQPLVESITDPYLMCIVTYALEVSGSEKRTSAYERMMTMRRIGESTYWADKEVPPNEVTVVDTLTYMQPRKWYDNEAYAVEATSYALLTCLRRMSCSQSQATVIMKWLQTMRNTNAGMASTQDSYMALKALREYARTDNNRALYKLQFEVRSVSNSNVTHKVSLDSSNWKTQQNLNIFPVYGSIRGTAKGTGLALMQLATDVNVEYPEQILPSSIAHFFGSSIKPVYGGFNSSIINYEACAWWDRPDISPSSNLAVMEIHMPTGYVITNDVLRGYAQSGDVPNMHHAEMYDDDSYPRRVVFYFDYLSTTQTCVQFRADRWFPVANMTLQHIFKVYNYYEPGMHNTTLYRTQTLFGHHICQVCGSFQCPYCPFYNVAPVISSSIAFSLLVTILSLVIAQRLTGFRWT